MRVSSSKSKSKAAATSHSRRRTPITISYFDELSPRLPALLASSSCSDGSGGEESAQVETRLRSYLALRPISQLRSALATDFAGFQRLAPDHVDGSAAPLQLNSAPLGNRPSANYAEPLALQLPISILADAAAVDRRDRLSARRQTPEDALHVLRYDRMQPQAQFPVEFDSSVREMDEDDPSQVCWDTDSEPEGEASRKDEAEDGDDNEEEVEEVYTLHTASSILPDHLCAHMVARRSRIAVCCCRLARLEGPSVLGASHVLPFSAEGRASSF